MVVNLATLSVRKSLHFYRLILWFGEAIRIGCGLQGMSERGNGPALDQRSAVAA